MLRYKEVHPTKYRTRFIATGTHSHYFREGNCLECNILTTKSHSLGSSHGAFPSVSKTDTCPRPFLNFFQKLSMVAVKGPVWYLRPWLFQPGSSETTNLSHFQVNSLQSGDSSHQMRKKIVKQTHEWKILPEHKNFRLLGHHFSLEKSVKLCQKSISVKKQEDRVQKGSKWKRY